MATIAGAAATAATAATVGSEVIQRSGPVAHSFLENAGLFQVVRNAFEHYREASLSVQAVIKNESSFELTDPVWYAHHGSHGDPVNKVEGGGSYEINFRKARNCFFGLSGYFQFTYCKEKRLIITFSVPWKDKDPNTVSVALLDPSTLSQKEMKSMDFGTDMYAKLKHKKIQKKMAAYETSVVNKGCRNPTVKDNVIQVVCSMGGSSNMTLDVVIRNS